MTPPTWRALAAHARRLGVKIEHGRHEASLVGPSDVPVNALALVDCRFVSWSGHDPADAIILRTAVAAALEQLERAAQRRWDKETQ